MKQKEIKKFELIYIKEDAKAHQTELKPQKYYPNTPLDTFPILYFEDAQEKKQDTETFVYNQKDVFISPIVGVQPNEKVSGIDDLTIDNSYRRFERKTEKLKDKKKIKTEFDLLDTKDYMEILANGANVKNEPKDNLGFSFTNDESFDDAPIKPNEYIRPIYGEEDFVEQTSDYEYEDERNDTHISKPIEKVQHQNLSKKMKAEDFEDEHEEEHIEYKEEDVAEPGVNMEEIIESHRINEPKTIDIKERSPKQYKSKKYVAPPLSFLKKNSGEIAIDNAWAQEKQETINRVFAEFNYGAKAIGYKVGPTVTLFLIDIEPGTDVNRLNNLYNTLRMRLKAKSLRIQSPIVGFDCAGIEISNDTRTKVLLGNLIDNKDFLNNPKKLMFPLGLNVNGEVTYANIEKMPHGLLAGTTGTGKSVTMNAIIISLLYRNSPEELRFIMVDPKKVEFTPYEAIPHLALPVIIESKKVLSAFKWACEEMDRRFLLFSQYRCKHIDAYNELLRQNQQQILPKIIIFVDELMDLMREVGNEIELYLTRLGAKARAAGIHVILATQRPSTDVIKGSIKNNVPSRIAFKVTSPTDSTTILDHGGAEKLLGDGDLLFKTEIGEERVQGAFISDDEIARIADYVSDNNTQSFLIDESELDKKVIEIEEADEDDELLEDIAYFCVRNNTASANKISQMFNMSFNRVNRVLIKFEKLGIVSSTVPGKSRTLIVNEEQLNDILANR